jgi:YHS domain-containing protein
MQDASSRSKNPDRDCAIAVALAAGRFARGTFSRRSTMMHRLVVVSLLVLSAACGGSAPAKDPSATSTPAPSATTAPAAKNIKAPGEAKVGDRARCPVSGEEFTVEASSPHADVDGKTYYFCCGDCEKEFKANPAKYLKKS